MALPTYAPDLHDLGVDGVGFMASATGDGQILRQDLGPATSQGALGDTSQATYETESFVGLNDWQGGAGQYRQVAADMFLDEIGDSRRPNIWYPARVKIPTGQGHADTYIWHVGTDVFAFQGSTIYNLTTGTSYAGGGTPATHPVVSGNLNTFYADTGGHLRRWRASLGAAVDITPAWYYAWCVAHFGDVLIAFGKRTDSLTIQQRSGYHAHAVGDGAQLTHEISWPKKTVPGDLLTLDVVLSAGTRVLQPVIDSTNTVLPQTTNVVPRIVVPPGWQRVGQASNGTDVTVISYCMSNAPERSGVEWVELSDAAHAVLFLDAYQGIRGTEAVDKRSKGSTNSGTSVTTNTTDATDYANELAHAAVGTAVATSFSAFSNSYTEVDDQPAGASAALTGATADKVLNATGTTGTAGTAGAAGKNAGVVTTYRGIDAAVAYERFQLLASRDEGSSWQAVPNASATGITQVRAATAAYNNLWFSDDYALYKLGLDEELSPLGVKVVDAGIERVGEYHVPYNGANGLWIAPLQGGMLVTAGGSVRRFAPGGEMTEVWPAENWVTVGGRVQALVAGEDGVYLGAGGRLWNNNGRGWHSLAAEPNGETGGFDYLHFHKGKVYYSPATNPGYFNMGYASQRPDLDADSVNWFTTGYLVQSLIDFGKVSADKVARYFESHALWYGTGSLRKLQLHYLVDPAVDPGQVGGGATSLPWVLIGEHLPGDGPTKRYELPVPVKGQRWWFRVTSVPHPGSGYPMLTGVVAFGRALMPSLKRIVATLEVGTGTVDAAGDPLYEDDSDVQAAIDYLNNLRELIGSGWLTVQYTQADRTSVPYVCTVESYTDNLLALQGDDAATFTAAIQLGALP